MIFRVLHLTPYLAYFKYMKTNLWEFFFLSTFKPTEAEFKEFEPLLKFKPRLKYGWFHLNLYSIFQDLSRRSIETGFWQI